MRNSPRALALALLLAPGLAGAQPWQEPEEVKPGVPYALLHGGLFVPRGASLEGFPAGHGFGAAAGYRSGRGAGFELDVRRGTTSTSDATATQQRIGAGLRLFGGSERLERSFSIGLGWYTTDVSFDAGSGVDVGSSNGRLGFQLGYAIVARLTQNVALGVEAAYGGAYATLFDEPAWIAGFTVDLALRVAFSRSAAPR